MLRRQILQSVALLPTLAHQAKAAEQTLRFVPQAALVNLDPTWSTSGISVNHGYTVFDTLYGLDATMQPQPQMAQGHEILSEGRLWRIMLRPNLLFHDGERVRASDCVASLRRWASRDVLGRYVATRVEAWEAVGDLEIRVQLSKPFPYLASALGRVGAPAFIAPARLIDAAPAGPVTEVVGSGPFRFLKDEFNLGERVAYARFDRYQPRPEPASWSSGGKRAYFDRLEWRILPDPSTAMAALRRGEVDWWQYVLPDLSASLHQAPGVSLQKTDPYGFYLLLRFNCVIPPFDNPRLRSAVYQAFSQDEFLAAIISNRPDLVQPCYAMFPCGFRPFEQSPARLAEVSWDLHREAIRRAGYAGEEVVILNPVDIAVYKAAAEIAADCLRRLGMRVRLQTMDWATAVQRRASTASPDKGGWNIFPNDSPSVFLANPLINPFTRGNGLDGYAGWYGNPQAETLVQQWTDSGDEADQLEIVRRLNQSLIDSPPFIPLGQYTLETAFRQDLTGILESPYSFPWNVRRG